MEQMKSCAEAKMGSEVQNSLKEEIFQLQKQLDDQFEVRCTLEKALSYRPLSHNPANGNSVTKLAQDLIRDIAVLEMEVVYLEKYLLSLYRKTFDQRLSSFPVDNSSKSTLDVRRGTSSAPGMETTLKDENLTVNTCGILLSSQQPIDDPPKKCTETRGGQTLVDSSIQRSHSSLSQRSTYSIRTSPPIGVLAEAVQSYHSVPLSMLERAHAGTINVTSLAEHLGSCNYDRGPETPNWLSEEMIKCISAIYCQLADPPLINQGFPSSPISCSSSVDEFPPQVQNETWSPECQKNSSFRSCLDSPVHVEGSKEFSGPYCTIAEVQWICRDSQRLRGVEHMLQKYRSLVSRLEEVDARKMKHEEKLAFWINVHNALVMHAFVVYGIPQNNLRRISLILKAAYNIGGLTINVDMIQSSILGCRLPRPGQWLQSLLFPKTKFKSGDARKAYAIEHPEPLLYFGLCWGSHSDPAVRMYTAKRVFLELEAAKEEYIYTVFRIRKEQKIQLPKIVDSFAKESGLCPTGLMDMIENCIPNSLRQSRSGKLSKKIEFVPHNFTFRYLLTEELNK